MECLFVLLALLFILATASPIGESLRSGHPSAGRSLRKLATRYNGMFRGSGIYMAPSVRLQHGQTTVVISCAVRHGTGKTTRAELVWPDSALVLSVRTRTGTFTPDITPRELSEYATGDARFDELFFVHTNQPEAAKTWLSEAVRWQLIQFATLPTGTRPGLLVTLQHHELVVEKNTVLYRFDDLEQFYLLAAQLYDQAMLTRATGITFLAEDEAQPVEAPICKVCGEPIESNMVICRRCRTPHHLDCWHYTGKCSTFGCPETHYDVPIIAPAPGSSSSSEGEQHDPPG